MEQIKQYCDSAASTNKLVHDLRAPIINIKGFSEEIQSALVELMSLVERYDGQLPVEFREAASEIVEEDLVPCLTFIGASVRKANEQLDELVSNKN